MPIGRAWGLLRRPVSIGCSKNQSFRKNWVIVRSRAEFVAAMRATLEVYTRPHDPTRPLVFLDCQNIKATFTARPGREARVDYEYERAGANLFMHFAPLVLSYILLAGKDARVWFMASNCQLHPEPNGLDLVSHLSDQGCAGRGIVGRVCSSLFILRRPMFWGVVHLDAFRMRRA